MSTSEAAFPFSKLYPTIDPNPIYRILLDYGADERSGTPLHPLKSLRQAMHQALYVHNRQRGRSLSTMKRIVELYTALLGQGSLEPVDTLVIARLLHLALLEHQSTSTVNCSLGICWYFRQPLREHEMGARLWDWVVHQDDRYVSTKTYAEAIEFAAISNQSLRVCEELYEAALIRCSDKHVSRILSPGFMLPHDLQDSTVLCIKPHLCLAIYSARLRKGDWRTAYLNLDTAFHLWPSPINWLFLRRALKGRPIHECYQVFMLSCQAGAYVRGKELHLLLNIVAGVCGDSADFGLKLDLIKAMLEAVLIFIKIKDARLDARHLVYFTAPGSPKQAERQQYGDSCIFVLILFDGVVLNARVETLCGQPRYRDILEYLWSDCSTVNLTLYNNLFYAAGGFRSAETVKIAWECLTRSLEGVEGGPRHIDWRIFAAAAKKTGLVPYYTSQLDLFVSRGEIEALAAKQADYVSRRKPINRLDQATYAENPDVRIAILSFLQKTRAILEDFVSTSLNRAKNIPLNRCSIWRWSATAPEEWQRRFYDEMSANSSVELPADLLLWIGGKARDSLGFSYRELRCRSWKAINNLLLQAEAFEHRKERLSESQDSTGRVQSIARSKLFKMQDGFTRPRQLPWLLEHLDDIEKESKN